MTADPNCAAKRPGDRWTFAFEAAHDPRRVGAVTPSGAALVRAMTDPVRVRAGEPLNVLEVGAGTGVVTRRLVRMLSPGSWLDIAESNPRFADYLQALVDSEQNAVGRLGAVRIHAAPV